MIIGFTGTQHGMTADQKETFKMVIAEYRPARFNHGGCIGADEDAHFMVVETIPVVTYPGVDKAGLPSKRGRFDGAAEVKKEKPYLDRNKDIVNDSDVMVATPQTFNEEIRSGTWSTVRYAGKVGKKVIVIWPDGSITTWRRNVQSS